MRIGYFIVNSLHYIPIVLPLIDETGGLIISLKKRALKYFQNSDKNYEDIRRDFSNLSVDILVHPSFSYKFFKEIPNVVHVQVFHGTSDKPFNFHKSLKFYDLITVPGPKMKDDIVKKGLAEPDKIVVIGYPKIDCFLHSNFNPDAFKDEIGIDNTKKTVLFSPTWVNSNKYSSFSKYIVSILRNLDDFNVVVKPHLNILKYRPWQILKGYIAKKKNCFIFPKSMNIIPFMAISDIMLTDISSVSHEYLPFDKPMVFLCPKPCNLIPDEHKWIWKCGDVVEKPSNLPHVVRENIENPFKYRVKRKEALHQIFCNFDGKSANRFKNALKSLKKRG